MFERIARLLGMNKDPKEAFVCRCILIVDDNETDRKLLQSTVEKMGHRAMTAVNGKEGYDMAKRQKPDLILSDCRMPGMDGIEMCGILKEDEETKDIPVVFLTGFDSPSVVVESFDKGVDNYMCKPINPKLLANQIESIFKEHLSSS